MAYKQKGQDINSNMSSFRSKTSNNPPPDGDSWLGMFSEVGDAIKRWWEGDKPKQTTEETAGTGNKRIIDASQPKKNKQQRK